jgi:3-oxoadipate enol-lactonase
VTIDNRNAKILHLEETPMPHLNVNGANLFYHESGRGLPVVLLHGFPLNHHIWHKMVPELSGVCRIITPDLRGFGQSPDNTAFTIQSLAEDIYVLLSQIRALPCIIGGLSMGGYVALAYERAYASTLRGLALIDTRAANDTPEGRAGRDTMIELAKTSGPRAVAEAMLPKMLAPTSLETRPEIVAELKAIMENCPAQTIQHALAAMRDRPDFRPTLGRIAAPTLIIVGDADAITPQAEADEMHNAIRGSMLNVIPGAGHTPPLEQPLQVSRSIRHFLGKLAS